VVVWRVRVIFFKKLLKSTAQDSTAEAGRGSEGRRGGGDSFLRPRLLEQFDYFGVACLRSYHQGG